MANLGYTYLTGAGTATTGLETTAISTVVPGGANYWVFGGSQIDCITTDPAAYAYAYMSSEFGFGFPIPHIETQSGFAPGHASGGSVTNSNQTHHFFQTPLSLFSSETVEYNIAGAGTISVAANIRNPWMLMLDLDTLNIGLDYFRANTTNQFALSGSWTTILSHPSPIDGQGGDYLIFATSVFHTPTTPGGGAGVLRLTRDSVPLKTVYTRTPQSTNSWYCTTLVYLLENENSVIDIALQAASGGNWGYAFQPRIFILRVDAFDNAVYDKQTPGTQMPDPFTAQASAAITPAMGSPEVLVFGGLHVGHTADQDVYEASLSADGTPIYTAGNALGMGLINNGGSTPEQSIVPIWKKETPPTAVPITYSVDTDRFQSGGGGSPTIEEGLIVAFELPLAPKTINATMAGNLLFTGAIWAAEVIKETTMAAEIIFLASLDVILGQRFADMNVAIMGTEERPVNMSAYILGGPNVGLNIAIRGLVEATASLDMVIFAIPETRSDLDMLIVDETPYRYMRMRGDFTTRYFGGLLSDVNFLEGFDPPNGGAIVTNGIGSFSDGHRRMTYTTKNQTPTPITFDKYSLLIDAAPITLDAIGLRVLVAFRLNSFGPNSDLTIGLFNDQLSPAESIASGNIAAFHIEAEKGHIEFRASFGTSSTDRDKGTALPVEDFIGKYFILEMEQTDIGVTKTMTFRLFDREASLSNPVYEFEADTTVTVTVDRFSITSQGRRVVELPEDQKDLSATFEFVDIELATGVLYAPPSTGVPLVEAKWRPIQDRPPIELTGEGEKTVYVALSVDGASSNIETSATVEVDSSDPEIGIMSFDPESDVTVPDSVNPPIVKGSLNSGFNGVSMRWYCSHPGDYTLRINSTGPYDGIEISFGVYDEAYVPTTTTWNFSDLPAVNDVYDVTLYVVADTGRHTAKRLGVFILNGGATLPGITIQAVDSTGVLASTPLIDPNDPDDSEELTLATPHDFSTLWSSVDKLVILNTGADAIIKVWQQVATYTGNYSVNRDGSGFFGVVTSQDPPVFPTNDRSFGKAGVGDWIYLANTPASGNKGPWLISGNPNDGLGVGYTLGDAEDYTEGLIDAPAISGWPTLSVAPELVPTSGGIDVEFLRMIVMDIPANSIVTIPGPIHTRGKHLLIGTVWGLGTKS